MLHQPKVSAHYDHRLDFIRFIAFLFVFVCHFVNNGGLGITSNPDVWWNNPALQKLSNFGREGVTLFFVLTGFLIGRNLLRDYMTNGYVSIKKFYFRRIARIWPLYFLFLLLCLIINLYTDNTGFTKSEVPWLLSFTYNWALYFDRAGGTISSITWSLSIEEQIYILLPLVVLINHRKRFQLFTFLFFTVGISSLILLDLTDSVARYNTLSYFLPLSFGLFLSINESYVRGILFKNYFVTLSSVLYVLTYPFFYLDLKLLDSSSIIFFLSSLYFFALLNLTDRFLNWRIIFLIAKLGKVSYGCYLYHFIVLFAFIHFEIFCSPYYGFQPLGIIIAFASTIFISYISYYRFEVFFIKFSRRALFS
jgi:peptidoglycan/LPS O-acetylase OafA/YrhL